VKRGRVPGFPLPFGAVLAICRLSFEQRGRAVARGHAQLLAKDTLKDTLAERGETEMPKMKTKSGAKKRFRRTATGKTLMNHACKRHNLRKRSQKMKRKARGTTVMSAVDARIVKKYMPYA
jgi:large subunit ribosomal protein L35